jgi:hypothetical protein
MAYWLHDHCSSEAIPVGRMRVSENTMAIMCNWADRIILMQPHMIESIHEAHHHKCKVVDVGPDRYGIWIHPDLLKQVQDASVNLP